VLNPLLIVFVGCGLIYFAVCVISFIGLFVQMKRRSGYTPTVSVLIAARNEEESIAALLNDLLAQTYPDKCFDITVIDDCSTDATAEIVGSFAAENQNIRQKSSDDSRSPYTHKKKAVHEGILSSDGEIIMTIDADCRVNSDWIERMLSYFNDDVDLVAGEVLIEGGGIMGMIETLEFTGIQLMSAGLMNMRFPITCNGANLAYRREAFDRVGGYEGVGSVVSGDDDLLMQKITDGNRSRAVYAVGVASAVRVEAVQSVQEFLSKRIRWASKITTYPSRSALDMLVVIFAFFVLVPFLVIYSIASGTGFMPFLIGYGLKTIGDFLLAGLGVVMRGRPLLLVFFPLAELVHVPYIIYVTLKGYFGSFEWHGRRTRSMSDNSGL